ncbi:hypothetical protein LINPERHAP2_LOCUS9540, partial [Linum perenne]
SAGKCGISLPIRNFFPNNLNLAIRAVILDLTGKQRERGGEAKGWLMPLLKAKTVMHLQLLVGNGGLKIGCCFSSRFLGL